jgi:hypothetical protein
MRRQQLESKCGLSLNTVIVKEVFSFCSASKVAGKKCLLFRMTSLMLLKLTTHVSDASCNMYVAVQQHSNCGNACSL